jgi:Flp pilus assembly protein TadD
LTKYKLLIKLLDLTRGNGYCFLQILLQVFGGVCDAASKMWSQLRYAGADLLIPTALWSQAGTSGTISGTLTDPTGDYVSGAALTLKNLGTSTVRTMKSGSGGVYAFTDLPPAMGRSGDPEPATRSFETAARLQPKAWQAWNNLGANYLALDHLDSAAKAFRKALAINPNATSAWFNLGSSLLRSGNKLEAFRALDHAQQIDSKDAQITGAWLEVAGSVAAEAGNAIDEGQYAKAFTMLSAVQRPLEKSASWNNLIGCTDFKLKKPEDAKRYIETALQIEPDNEGYLLDVGEFLATYHAYGEATKFFEVGLERMPHSAPVRFGLAISYLLQNRTSQAASLLERLHLEYPEWTPVARALGECYEAGAHWSAMINLGTSLESREPKNAFGWYLEGAGQEKLAH